MTCDDCQAIIIDTARGGEIGRAARDEARRHAALCARCGEQQQDQQWLTTQLRAVAAEASTHNAPPRVEIAVLAAWRASQDAAAIADVSSGANAAVAPSQLVSAVSIGSERDGSQAARAKRPRRWMISGFALAGLAAAAMALLIVWPAARSASQAAAPAVSTLHSANHSDSAGTRAALDRNKQDRGDGAQAPVAASAKAEDTAANAPPVRRMTPPRARVEAVMASAAMQDAEFLPLPYVEPLRSTEARQVIRVSMTSGDEMILGMLPADRRSGQPFEADVLVGEDGIARAIRIVH